MCDQAPPRARQAQAVLLRAPPEVATLCGPSFTTVARGKGWFAFPVSLDEEEGLVAVSIA